MMCKPKWLRSAAKEPHPHEIGSNAFGSAVLLPDFLLRKRCEVSPVSLEVPWQITKEYDVSILASARRFVELSSERCAVVFAKDGVVQWSTRSATYTRKIREGRRLHCDSIAWDFYKTGKLDKRDQPVPARALFGTTSNEDMIEHATCRPDYGTVLSLLGMKLCARRSRRTAYAPLGHDPRGTSSSLTPRISARAISLAAATTT